MSSDPKNVKLNGVFHQNINTSTQQNNQEAPMEEENLQKKSTNPQNVSQTSILTTMSSIESQNHQGTLDIFNISNNTNLNSSEDMKISQPKNTEEIYSFGKEYFDEVYQNLLLDEQIFYQKINFNYMNNQNSINDKMRAILVDWLIDIHFRFNMKQKTLFHCIYIIDAFLSKDIIDRKDFQLLGMAALLIACKESEVMYPTLNSFLAISDYTYTLQELKDMERRVIKKLDFDILAPTAEEFYEINAEYFEFTEKQRFLGEYFLDASLIDYGLLKYKQSTIAVACGYIVMKFFKLNGVHLILKNTFSDVKQKDVKNCARDLCFLVKNLSNSSLGATKNKYMSDKYIKVAELCEDN
jgi:cyclin B